MSSESLPPNFARSSANDTEAIQEAVSAIHSAIASSLVMVTIESALFAAYTVVIIIAVILLIGSSTRSLSKRSMMLACIAMYGTAATHWAFSLRSLIFEQQFARDLLDVTSSCIAITADATACTANLKLLQNPLPVPVTPSLPTALLSVNIVLGDSVVLWRAWILWARNRVLQVVSLLLIISTTVTSSLCSATAGTSSDGKWGMAAFALSWATNIWATSLISVKAWQYRRVITYDLLCVNARAQAEKVLMLFVDSGVLYCALWTVMVAGALRSMLPTASASTSSKTFASDIIIFKESGLVHVIGIYPTALIILVALTKSYCERTLRFDSLPSLRFESFHRHAATQFDHSAETLDTDIQPSARTASSVVDVEGSLPSTIVVQEKAKKECMEQD